MEVTGDVIDLPIDGAALSRNLDDLLAEPAPDIERPIMCDFQVASYPRDASVVDNHFGGALMVIYEVLLDRGPGCEDLST